MHGVICLHFFESTLKHCRTSYEKDPAANLYGLRFEGGIEEMGLCCCLQKLGQGQNTFSGTSGTGISPCLEECVKTF